MVLFANTVIIVVLKSANCVQKRGFNELFRKPLIKCTKNMRESVSWHKETPKRNTKLGQFEEELFGRGKSEKLPDDIINGVLYLDSQKVNLEETKGRLEGDWELTWRRSRVGSNE